MRRSLLSLSLSLAVATAAAPAAAKPQFPSVIQQRLGMASTPPCSLCHDGAPSGSTVTTPFGVSIACRNVSDTDSLNAALTDLGSKRIDANGDGSPDIEQLAVGGDPNAGGLKGDPRCDANAGPQYGCATHPGDAPAGLAALLTATALLATRARRRR